MVVIVRSCFWLNVICFAASSCIFFFVFFKQKAAYEMRISDWSSDVCSSDLRALSETVDGQMQTFAAKDGHYNREHFFGRDEELARLAQSMTDEQIDRLRRGGHDLVKIHAAYAAAARHRGQPTVIFAHTKKGDRKSKRLNSSH